MVGNFRSFLLLGSNVWLAISIILMNKSVFRELDFHFPTTLTLIHFVVIFLGTELLRRNKVYKQRKNIPISRTLILVALLTAFMIPLNNLSLKLNPVGIYQILKLLVTPAIVFFSWIIKGNTISFHRGLLLVFVIVGVAICIFGAGNHGNDFSLNVRGILVGVMFVPGAALYKILWKECQMVENNSCDTLSFIHRVYPFSIFFVLLLSLYFDFPDVLTYSYSFSRCLLLFGTGILAFLISISSLTVVVQYSPLTHQILGLLKIVISTLGAALLLKDKEQITDVVQLFGAFIAMISIMLYTRQTIDEQNKSKKQIPRKDSKV